MFVSASAAELNFPNRPIRMIVPQSAGGSTDLAARAITQKLSETLKQNVVVDNRPGAGSLNGTDIVAIAPPDGHTLLAVAASFTINPSLHPDLPFDPVRDFAPVTVLTSYPNIVVVHPSLPVTTIKELIALAKAKPGTLNFGSGGAGTPTHLGPELLKSMAGIDIVNVPYKGGGPGLAALLGAQVQLYFGPIATVLQFIKEGRLRAIAVTSLKRSSVAPDVPTVAESGLPGFEQITWNGIAGPARTPPAVIARLYKELTEILKTPSFRDRFAADGVDMGGMPPAELLAYIKSEIPKWGKVIRAAGIQPE